MNSIFKNRSWVLALAILALSACKKDSGADDSGTEGSTGDKYFIAASISDGTTTAFTYTMAVKDLAKDTVITTQFPGTIENIGGYTQWGYSGTNALFAISYQQGNPAPGSVFQLSSTGVLKKIDDFVLDKGFNTIGTFSHYLVAAANGETLTGTNNGKLGSVFYSMDVNANNAITPYQVVGEKLIGGQTASFVGIADAGNENFFSAINLAVGANARPVNLDSIYVAKLDATMNIVTIYKDDRLSASGGQFRSARYGQIANDADGNTYVFSTGYGLTTKKSGALLIKKNAATFDGSYYFDIETASEGFKLRKVWNITSDYFLLEMYNAAGVQASSAAATQYAVVRMSTKDFKWVRTGFPTTAEITSVGWPFTADGKAYISAVTPATNPTVYVIDPLTATATKGISISGVTSIPGMGKLSPQSTIN